MEYKNKYIKYKIKYLESQNKLPKNFRINKKQVGGTNEIQPLVQTLNLENCLGDVMKRTNAKNLINKTFDYKMKDTHKEYTENLIFQDYFSMNDRLRKLNEMMNNKVAFGDRKIFMMGYGGVGRPLLYMILKTIDVKPSNITVFDQRDVSAEAQHQVNMLAKGVKFVQTKVVKENYKELLKDLGRNDILIDVCVEIETLDMMKLCQERGACHINSCIQDWDYKTMLKADEYSLGYKHHELDKWFEELKSREKVNFNCIISMGCNPGDVSIWTKVGLEQIAKQRGLWSMIKNTNDNKQWAALAQRIGIQTIHISERDTQRSSIPKRVNEYCNTWSSTGEAYFEEALGCVEASWGTHETTNFKEGDKIELHDRYLIWRKIGAYTYAQSWVPLYGRLIGNVIRHDESFSIGRALTVTNNNQIIYKPSVYYVYHPTNEARMSLEELKDRNHIIQDNFRFLTDELISGRDILGLTFYLADGSVYWCGSLLSIEEARKLYNNEYDFFVNATNIPVVAGYLSGIMHMIKLCDKGIYNGLMVPDDLPYMDILKNQLPLIGELIFVESDFKLTKSDNKFEGERTHSTQWTFDNFLVERDLI